MSDNITTIANELDDLAKSFKLDRLKTEYGHYKILVEGNNDDGNTENDENGENDENDNIAVGVNNNMQKLEQLEAAINSYEILFKENKNKIQDAFSQIDKYVYMKPWKKLPNFHKNVKIREYVLERYKDHKEVEKILMDAVESNELKINSSVVYDQSLCKILDIPILKENSGKYYLEAPKKISRGKKIVDTNSDKSSDK